MPEFYKVAPAPAVADLSKATIALVTTSSIVQKGNPITYNSHLLKNGQI